MKSNNPHLYLIDISSLFFRSYYAITLNMKNEKGLPTNALYGVLKMIDQISRQKKPDYMICCFDTKEGSSFRKKLYANYKANRTQMPEDLEVQVPYLKKLIEKLLIPCWEKPGIEADDLIASIVSAVKEKNWNIFIVSGDKDFAQIVTENVFLYDTMKNIIYTPEKVEEKWQLPPEKIKDYLSLTGDSSDNIPGVKGIGPKGAVQLLQNYKNLEDIYQNTDQIQSSLKKKLLKDKQQAFLSRKLIDLKKDLPVDQNFLKKKHTNIQEFSKQDKINLKFLLEELNFKSFLKKFFPVKNSQVPLIQTSTNSKNPIESSLSNKSYKGITSHVSQSKYKRISVEEFKRNLDPYSHLNVGLYEDQFYLLNKKNYILVTEKEFKSLSPLLDYKWIRYLGYNLKYFWKILNIKRPLAKWDSLIAGHLLKSLSEPSLRKLFQIYLNIPFDSFLNLEEFLYQEQKLQEKLSDLLEQEAMKELYQDVELALTPVLYEMEKIGFCIDIEEIKKQSLDLEKDIHDLEFQIHKMIGEEFNLSSPKQLGVILFEKLKLPKGRKTKTGYSTDSHELLKIKNLHPVLPLLLEHRELSKLKNTYTDPLIQFRNPQTGRIHTEFKQTVASTGRLSSLNPNLQNIPIRTQRGHLIRKAFIAEKGKKIICADYSQIELRILSEITGDPNLQKAFENQLDIHSLTASEIFNVPLKEVSKELRRKSKAVNFGIAYGQGAFGLADNLSISRTESKQIIENYFKKFKKVKDYIETIKEEITKKNYVKTLYGRKRFFNTEDLKNPKLKARIERAAINAPIQGTASDLVKKAMIELNESLPIPILSQVHDELLFEAPENKVEQEVKEIIAIMENNSLLKTPLTINISVGKNWFSIKNVSP
ncbi:MAG: DNA polymerase I [Bdellovibrionales bacterium]|nr:DNA polymerase I [Bdellovibrionales bacterium]